MTKNSNQGGRGGGGGVIIVVLWFLVTYVCSFTELVGSPKVPAVPLLIF